MDLPAYEAVALTALGDTVGAIKSLRAFLTNAPLMRSFVGSHPSFSGLALHPEFQHLTKVLH
jgi:hypothetical protein